MSRTDHVRVACGCVEAARQQAARETRFTPDLLIAEAQAHATLALVEVQREANDIARASARTALAQLRVGVADLPLLLNLAVRPVGEYGIDLVPEVASALGITNDKETN